MGRAHPNTGDLIYFRLIGLDFIVVNSEIVARALMDQRSAIYSDRPFIATNKLYVWFYILTTI
jgi:hypothetical protein